jgi:hypothetical protein
LRESLVFRRSSIAHFGSVERAIELGNGEHVRFGFGKGFILNQVILFGKHLPLLLPGLNRHEQRLLGIFRLKLQVIKIIALDLLAQLRGRGVVVTERNAHPGELDPNPPLIIVEGGLDMRHSIVFPDLAEGVLDLALRPGTDYLADFVHIQVQIVTGRGLANDRAVALVLFHKLLQQLQVMVPELLPVHRHVHVQLLDFAQYPQV